MKRRAVFMHNLSAASLISKLYGMLKTVLDAPGYTCKLRYRIFDIVGSCAGQIEIWQCSKYTTSTLF